MRAVLVELILRIAKAVTLALANSLDNSLAALTISRQLERKEVPQ